MVSASLKATSIVYDESPLGRAFRLLEVLARHPNGLTLSEIARESGLVVTTAHRQLASLIGCQVVRKTDNKIFVPGPALWRVISLLTNGADIVQAAVGILTELADRFGETTFLARLHGHNVEIMTTCMPTTVGKAYAQPGRDMPLYAAATGKILLAAQSNEFIDSYMNLPRHAFTPSTQIDEASIRAEIAKVREHRIATCENEFDPEILSYATSVIDPRTNVFYAIAIFGMRERFGKIPRANVETQLIYAAQRLTTSLSQANC